MYSIKKPLYYIATLFNFLFVSGLLAQESGAMRAENSYFKASVSYLSNAVYNGRKDSLVVPYITSSVGFYHHSGFSINGSASYQTAAKYFDVFSFDATYSFHLSDKISVSLNADKPFYNTASTAVQSGIKGSGGVNLLFDLGVLDLNTGVSAVFSDVTDIMANASISHSFQLNKEDAASSFNLTPSLSINLGKQGFYQSYKSRVFKKQNAGVNSSSTSGDNAFELLALELSLPFSYDAKTWGISFVPTYAIPKNPITTTTISSITIGSITRSSVKADTEKLSNVFYTQVELYFKF